MEELMNLPVNDSPEDKRRAECHRCQRPPIACWCWALPSPRIQVRSKIIILQHPFEERRPLRTAPMIQHGLAPGRCSVFKGKRFHTGRYSDLDDALTAPNCVLLYPSPDATDIRDLPPLGADTSPATPYTVVILDGTWRQARSIYSGSPPLHALKKVHISGGRCSNYVVRTQPSECCLSTVEAAAVCLQHVEQLPRLPTQLLAPLHALCHVQLHHGAAPHDSRPTQLRRTNEYAKVDARELMTVPIGRYKERQGGKVNACESKTTSIGRYLESQDSNSVDGSVENLHANRRTQDCDSSSPIDQSISARYSPTYESSSCGSALYEVRNIVSHGIDCTNFRRPISGVVL